MPRPVKASPVARLASIYRDVAEMSDTDLLVWSIGMALMQVEGAYSLAVDPFLSRSRRLGKEVDACEALTARLRELAEMVKAVAPLQD